MAKDAKIMLHGHTWPHFFIQTSPAAALRHLAMPPKTSHATLQCAHKWIPYNRAMINASPVWQWADRFACLKCNYFLVRCKYVDDTETKCGEDLIWKSMNPSNFGDHFFSVTNNLWVHTTQELVCFDIAIVSIWSKTYCLISANQTAKPICIGCG